MKRFATCLLTIILAAHAQAGGGNFGDQAADFPPGAFSDGAHYKLEDFQGKLLVLFFFESECPTCKGKIPLRNAVVEQFKDKPVKFIAVSPHNSAREAQAYINETKLKMPVFADNLNIMESMYGQTISLHNIYQFRVINPVGNVVAYDMEAEAITKALENVKWKYKDGGYDARLSGVVELLEWNQFEPALTQLRPLRKAQSKSLAESAEKLYQAVKVEGEQWKATADKLPEAKACEQYDLYLKISNVFAGDDLAKSVAEPLKALKVSKLVMDELAARQMYGQLYTAVPRAKPQQSAEVAQFCENIASKFPGTPTAEKAKQLAEAINKAPAAN